MKGAVSMENPLYTERDEEYSQERFLDRLRLAISRSGMSAKMVMHCAGLSPNTVTNAKHGKQGMSASSIFRLCRVLDVSADWLLGLED